MSEAYFSELSKQQATAKTSIQKKPTKLLPDWTLQILGPLTPDSEVLANSARNIDEIFAKSPKNATATIYSLNLESVKLLNNQIEFRLI